MNQVILMGRICNDLTLEQSSGGKTYLNVTVAVKRSYKNSNGEYDTDFFRCVAFGKNAEFINKYFEKGKKILVTAELRNNNYEKDGKTHYQNQIVISTSHFIDDKSKSADETSQPKVSSKSHTNNSHQADTIEMIGDLDDFEEIIACGDGGVPF